MDKLKSEFIAARVSNYEGIDVMSRYFKEWDYVLDPHTAIGVGAAEKLIAEDEDVICLATAHPGKFQGPVEKALEKNYVLPEALSL